MEEAMTQRVMATSLVAGGLVLCAVVTAAAQETPLLATALAEAAKLSLQEPANQTAAPTLAVEYSDAYRIRAKIHRVASFATLPLFATEGFVGQSLYNDPTEGKKTAHLAVATGIGALFAVNTVTGVWNLVESRHDPNASRRRWVHGLLMLGADAGFLATAMTAPESEHGMVDDSRATHRAIAFTSIGAASAGYLIMLFGGH
jgi:hypothetical protein